MRRREPLDPLECVACLVYERLQAVAGDRAREARVLAKAAELVARWPSRTSVFVESYDYVERLLGVHDLYREKREELSHAVLEALGALDLAGMEDWEIFSLMAAANGVDIPMPGYRPGLEKLLRGLRDRAAWLGLGEGDVEKLLGASERIVVVLDNAGEAVLDIAAAGELARRAGKPLYLVARGEPYEVDVTAREAVELAARLEPGARVVSTGGRYPVFHPRASQESRSLLADGSLVLVKGIANLEAFLDYPDAAGPGASLVFMLRAKCGPLSRFFRVGHAEPVVASAEWLLERLREWRSPGG
ncbi:hypothetical protein CF15_08105 [Pyrodictium occultum]|uniref:Damage-control phosphatase ARMT1-like metal-binding domain-containing protein n=1 Tax=Pyrodictium occultum TaxID=2309 RepID=A0A0V8RRP6_PYROC|nr:hypothetical protein CF15_08105 [Pyrodictium occultum]